MLDQSSRFNNHQVDPVKLRLIYQGARSAIRIKQRLVALGFPAQFHIRILNNRVAEATFQSTKDRDRAEEVLYQNGRWYKHIYYPRDATKTSSDATTALPAKIPSFDKHRDDVGFTQYTSSIKDEDFVWDLVNRLQNNFEPELQQEKCHQLNRSPRINHFDTSVTSLDDSVDNSVNSSVDSSVENFVGSPGISHSDTKHKASPGEVCQVHERSFSCANVCQLDSCFNVQRIVQLFIAAIGARCITDRSIARNACILL